MSSSMSCFLIFSFSTIILFLATIAQQRLRKKLNLSIREFPTKFQFMKLLPTQWEWVYVVSPSPPPTPNSVILIFNFLSFRRKTQWDVPSWDSSPSSEEEHPYVVPEPDHTSISAHSYVDMDEVRQTSNLIGATTSLSTQNEIWSQLFLLFLQDSPPKPKIKKLAKAPTTPPETPPESPTLTYTTAPADTTAHRRGDHLLRDGTSSSSSSHQSKNRELFRMKVSWVRLSGDVTFPEPVRPALRHGLFLNMSRSFYRFQNHIIPVVLLTQVNSSIVSDVLYICLLTGVFSFSIFLSAAF